MALEAYRCMLVKELISFGYDCAWATGTVNFGLFEEWGDHGPRGALPGAGRISIGKIISLDSADLVMPAQHARRAAEQIHILVTEFTSTPSRAIQLYVICNAIYTTEYLEGRLHYHVFGRLACPAPAAIPVNRHEPMLPPPVIDVLSENSEKTTET
jgi:hypothetical protein